MKTLHQLEAITAYKTKCFYEDKSRLVERANRIVGQKIRRAQEEIERQNEFSIEDIYAIDNGGCCEF